MKIKWKVQEPPTGRYRSFDHRGWPGADYVGVEGCCAVQLLCDDDYVPRRVREGAHKELKIGIACYYDMEDGRESFKWKYLIKRAATLDEAKNLAQRFIDSHPEVWPKALRPTDTK